MEKIDTFMEAFFRARIADEEAYQQQRAPFRGRFFTKDCRYDSHADTIGRLRSEKIVAIEETAGAMRVVTQQKAFLSKKVRTMRTRYSLVPTDTSWLIRKVETSCPLCDAPGSIDCPYCKGTQWRV